MKELRFDDLQQINGGGIGSAIVTTACIWGAVTELYDFGRGVAAGLK